MNKIRKYVNDLFKEIRETKKSVDLKEELIADLEEKYNDLISNGKTSDEAYKIVISGIGDIDELLDELRVPIYKDDSKLRKKNALVVTICVALYIFSLITVIIFDELLQFPETLIGISFFVISGLSTCILIYHFMSIPKYKKDSDTLVEDFKEWKHGKGRNQQLKNSLNIIVWLLALIIYFLISFSFNCWYISWIIFLIAPLISIIINLFIDIKEG